jgi:hypothetical protein
MALIPLWDDKNLTLYSSVFNIPTGQVGVLLASNMRAWNHRTDAREARTQQRVCVRRLLHEWKGEEFPAPGFVVDPDVVKADKIVDTFIWTDCRCPWSMTMKSNIRIIGIPGHYRLELSDSTVIGVVQVYLELLRVESIPLQVSELFFK